jgi:hypothetical protein
LALPKAKPNTHLEELRMRELRRLNRWGLTEVVKENKYWERVDGSR